MNNSTCRLWNKGYEHSSKPWQVAIIGAPKDLDDLLLEALFNLEKKLESAKYEKTPDDYQWLLIQVFT